MIISVTNPAAILYEKLKSLMSMLPPPQSRPEDYMEFTGIDRLYPRAAAYVTHPTDLSLALKKTVTDSKTDTPSLSDYKSV